MVSGIAYTIISNVPATGSIAYTPGYSKLLWYISTDAITKNKPQNDNKLPMRTLVIFFGKKTINAPARNSHALV
jgi:hypothetical protein